MNVSKIIKNYLLDEKESFLKTVARFRIGVESVYDRVIKKIGDFSFDSRAKKKKNTEASDEQKKKKAIFTLCSSLVVVMFFVWQFLAYEIPQTAFVIVNIILFAFLSMIVSLILYKSKKDVKELNDAIDEMNFAKKKRDQEMAQMKSELLDMRMTMRKQTTFGKNSQALIEAVQKNKKEVREGEMKGQYLLRSLVQCYQICGGVIYILDPETNKYELAGEYALNEEPQKREVDETDGLVGQVIVDGKAVHHENVPSDYMTILSGLGKTESVNLYILPVKSDDKVVAVIEISSFGKLTIVDVWKDIESLLLTEL